MTNYQQTTKIIQEFNIQQSTTSDITVSSTINIKSKPKQPMKLSTNDLLSEADFQRVVQDITPADRDLFDEFLNGIKQKTDDYLFLSSFDDLPTSSSQEQDSISRRHSSFSFPTQTSSIMSSDRRRNSIPRGSSTIHYSPHSMPISNRPPPPPPQPTAAAAQTLKQMAVQHQQRAMHNQQQQQLISYPNIPYNNNSIRQYYHQSESDSVSFQKKKTKILLSIKINLDIILSTNMLSICSTNKFISFSTTFKHLWYSKLFLSNFIIILSTTTTTATYIFLSYTHLFTVKRSSANFFYYSSFYSFLFSRR